MKLKIVSLFFCVVMVSNVVFPMIQVSEAPSPTSGGSGGLADSPWPMYGYDTKHTGQSPYDTSQNNGQLKWSFATGHHTTCRTSAIGSDGTIYVGSDDHNLYAINPEGTEKWHFTTGDDIDNSPAIGSDGTIYIGSLDCKLYAIGNLKVDVSSHFTTLNSAAQSSITVHVTDDTNPVQGATVTLSSDNGGLFNPHNGITDSNGIFKSIFNAPTVTTVTICRISAQASKTEYNDESGYVNIFIKPIPWPMFRQNLNHTGVSPYDTSTNPGKLKWSFTTDGPIDSSPTISSDGTIYIGSHDKKLYAINPDGTEKWNFTTNDRIQWASPTIGSDGTIYIGSLDRKLYAINPDGTQKWNFITSDIIFSSATEGSDGTIYIGSWDEKLYAINPDGSEKWNFPTGRWINTSPAIGSDGTIYIGSHDNNIYAINSDGTEKWHFSVGGYVETSPVVDTDGTVYFGSWDKKLWAVNSYGNFKWSFITGDQVLSSPAIGSSGTIYVGSNDNKLYAINPDGTEIWNFTTGFLVQSSPSIGSDGTIYVGSFDKKMYALNPNGTEKWNFKMCNFVRSSPAIDTDGTIYIGCMNSKLYAIGEGATPPIANAGPDHIVNESDVIQFNGITSNVPDCIIVTYQWDFDSSDGLWWETGATPDAIGPTPTYIYGDDGVYVVTLRVTDNDNLLAKDTCNITVLNVDPTVEIVSATMDVEIGLRVAGRKFNDVGMTLSENEKIVGYVSIERLPGSPNEQMAWIPITLDLTKTYSATVTYTPEDPPNLGANPVWIYIRFPNGSIQKIHHTFNVQQSKNRDSEHWNHIEPWEVDLNAHLIGWEFEVDYHVTDPGSDDEILTFSYGTQEVEITHLNNPPNTDPYPSPEINPRDIYGTATLVYEGAGNLILQVEDDDGGLGSTTLNIN